MFCAVYLGDIGSADLCLGIDNPSLTELDFVGSFGHFDVDFANLVYDFLETRLNKLVVGVEMLSNKAFLLEKGLL
jgi:hypothetical protein